MERTVEGIRPIMKKQGKCIASSFILVQTYTCMSCNIRPHSTTALRPLRSQNRLDLRSVQGGTTRVCNVQCCIYIWLPVLQWWSLCSCSFYSITNFDRTTVANNQGRRFSLFMGQNPTLAGLKFSFHFPRILSFSCQISKCPLHINRREVDYSACSEPLYLTKPNVLRKHHHEVWQFSYNLRPRPHGFTLPSKDDRNFISRLLYKDMY